MYQRIIKLCAADYNAILSHQKSKFFSKLNDDKQDRKKAKFSVIDKVKKQLQLE